MRLRSCRQNGENLHTSHSRMWNFSLIFFWSPPVEGTKSHLVFGGILMAGSLYPKELTAASDNGY